jgi:uncharacterized protein YjeT (DUF2065 family)
MFSFLVTQSLNNRLLVLALSLVLVLTGAGLKATPRIAELLGVAL